MRKIVLIALLMFSLTSVYSQKAFVGSVVSRLDGTFADHSIQDSTVILTVKVADTYYPQLVKEGIDEAINQFSPFISVIVPWGVMQEGKSFQSVYNVVSGAVGIFYFMDVQEVKFMWHLADFPGSQEQDFLKTNDTPSTTVQLTGTESGSTAIETNGDYEYSLPIHLGDSKEKVISIYGEPDRSGDNFQSFFNHGLVINYESNKVKSVKAALLATNIIYTGKIYGIKVGDNIEDCRRLWGKEIQVDETKLDYDNITWAYQGKLLKLEIWNRTGKQRYFGSYTKGQVKTIELSW